MPDGSLPSVKVRSTMLRLLLQLNFYFEDRKVCRPLICCCEAGCVLSALWLQGVVVSVLFAGCTCCSADACAFWQWAPCACTVWTPTD
jgi:hypothetical protein